MKYEIKGAPLPVVEVNMEQGESLITDSGAMSWMTPGLVMETTSNGGLGSMFGRMFSGETLFLNRYTAQQPGMIAFASSFPGDIMVVDIDSNNEVIVQKSAFLASEETVSREIFFSKKLGTGVFGGEGFIMNKFSGHGKLFLEIDGSCCTYELAAGQQMILDTGHLVMMSATCTMDIQTVKGMKNKLLGGEGFFNTIVTGPGQIYVQTMPVSSVASSLIPYLPTSNK